MRCIVTGTDGFVGKNLRNRLVDDGWDVEEIERDDYNSLSIIQKVKDTDIIFHVGAISDVSNHDYNYMLKYNYSLSQVLFDLAETYNKKVIYSSSSSIYGNGNLPENIYAWSKYLAEQYGMKAVTNFVALRYFNVYGPGEKHKNHMSSLILHIYNSEKFKIFPVKAERDFIYVDDVVNANIKAVESEKGIYDVGTGQGYKYETLCDLVGREYGYARVDDVPAGYQAKTKADSSKFLKGWKPNFTIEEGIKKYKEHLDG